MGSKFRFQLMVNSMSKVDQAPSKKHNKNMTESIFILFTYIYMYIFTLPKFSFFFDRSIVLFEPPVESSFNFY